MPSPKEAIKAATVDVFHINDLWVKPRVIRKDPLINNKNILVIEKKLSNKKPEVQKVPIFTDELPSTLAG